MLKKIFLFLVFVIFNSSIFAQEETITEVSESKTTKGDVPFAVIENVPVYPDCTGNNEELKKCMSTKISEFINIHFDMKKIEALNLPPKIYKPTVQFKIDKNGEVVAVSALGPHPEIENEAVRVVKNLPQLQPGKQKGEAVGVLYSLPIVFKIEPPKRGKKGSDKQKAKKLKN
jgi:protein TonB